MHPLYTGEARVDLAAVRANVAELGRRAGAAEVMAVVKADAYGHGLLPSARAALQGGASWLGVAQLSEALALREGGVSAPVLCWLQAPGSDLAPAVAHGVDVGVSAPWALDAAVSAAATTGRPARVQLKVDTGLGRNGAFHQRVGGAARSDWETLVDAAARARAAGSVEVTGIFTHFAYADAPHHPTVRAQQEAFTEAVRVAEAAGLRDLLRHMANSAAVLTSPESAWDMVRPGVAVYGLSPVPELGGSADFGLVPAMTATARVALVKEVPQGQGVSYGHTYTTPAPTRLADVPLGYADGVPRHASNRAEVLVGGARRRIAGRVCMDQFVVDVGDLPVAAGDEVLLFGPGTHGEPTAQDWAEACGTINYEIVTRFGARVPRVHLGQAEVRA